MIFLKRKIQLHFFDALLLIKKVKNRETATLEKTLFVCTIFFYIFFLNKTDAKSCSIA